MHSEQRIGVLYTRISDDENHTFSIASQVKYGLEYADYQGIYVPQEYIFEETFSGYSDDRPELNKIKRLMRSGKIDCIIAYDTTRVARRIGVADFLLQEIFDNNVQLHLVSWRGPVNDTPYDRQRFYHEAVYSDTERRVIRERSMRGRRQKIEEDRMWVRGNIDQYGYRSEGSKRNSHLIIVEDEARIIQLIFHLFVYERWQVAHIAKFLTGTGIPTASQTRRRWRVVKEWQNNAIYRILKTQSYIGIFYAYKYQKINGNASRRDQSEWFRLDYPELRIIDDETFNKAQELLAIGRTINARKPEHQYMLARRLRCKCGYMRSSVPVRKYLYYICRAKQLGKVQCSIPNVRAEMLDAKAWTAIENLIRMPELTLDKLREAQQEQFVLHEDALASMQSAERYIQQWEAELSEVYQDYRAGHITKNMYLAEKEKLDRQLKAAQEVYDEYKEKFAQRVLSEKDIRVATRECKNLADYLDRVGEITFEHQRKIIELLNITGKHAIENGIHIVYLYIHDIPFDKLDLGEVSASSLRHPDYLQNDASEDELLPPLG
jgi:DNA invertase Pin-like site-specific DNA recombinase